MIQHTHQIVAIPTMPYSSFTIAWPVPFADADYDVTFSVEEDLPFGNASTIASKIFMDHKDANGVSFAVSNITGAVRTVTINLIGIKD